MSAFVLYFAGLLLVGAAAWAVARPLFGPRQAPALAPVSSERGRWRRQKDEALAAIRDAEFDYQLGKLSEADYRQLRARLEQEAVEAIRALEKG